MRKGMALLAALLALSFMIAAALYLTRAIGSRVGAQRQGVQREAALRKAEAALERARDALQLGSLLAGGVFQSEGLAVSSKPTPQGVRLEVWAMPTTLPTGAKIPRFSRGVRIEWDLERDVRGTGWQRVDWRARNEITPP